MDPLPPPQRSLRQRIIDYLAASAEDFPSFETITEDYLRSIHLAVFYLWGRYYNLSKRSAGIRLVGFIDVFAWSAVTILTYWMA